MWDIIRRLMDRGTTILLTTQYLEEADQLADQIVVIDDGKVIAEGTAKELKSKIGKDRLELSFKGSEVYESAVSVLGKSVAEKNEKESAVTVLIKDTDIDVKATLDTLAAKKIKISGMAIHKPTLDDVFLSLTGKVNKENADEEEEK
jgi:ABC-2 type transport system ATP-binding protein